MRCDVARVLGVEAAKLLADLLERDLDATNLDDLRLHPVASAGRARVRRAAEVEVRRVDDAGRVGDLHRGVVPVVVDGTGTADDAEGGEPSYDSANHFVPTPYCSLDSDGPDGCPEVAISESASCLSGCRPLPRPARTQVGPFVRPRHRRECPLRPPA